MLVDRLFRDGHGGSPLFAVPSGEDDGGRAAGVALAGRHSTAGPGGCSGLCWGVMASEEQADGGVDPKDPACAQSQCRGPLELGQVHL